MALTLGALALASCSESIVSPTVGTSFRRTAGASVSLAGESFLHSNAEKYADAGAHPATGRSGSAAIEARALLGKDGNTVIEVTTGHMDVPGAPGNINKAQLKSLTANGEVLRTMNFNGLAGGGYWTTTTAGLGRGAPLQIQTNVGGIDGNRTDVVTVRAITQRRPDLAVLSVSAPDKANVNNMVNVTAFLSELNGDVGARANCVLLADGTQIDQSLGIWVDAGSGVSCAFTTMFSDLGTKTLTVNLTGVVPGDWDLSNNSASTTVDIVQPIVGMYWFSSASASSSSRLQTYAYQYYNCPDFYFNCNQSDYESNNEYRYNNSNFSFGAYSFDLPAAGPMNIAFTATSGGNSLAIVNGTSGDLSNPGCYNGYDAGSQGWFSACNYGVGYIVFNFDRHAGGVTYYSWGYSHSRRTYFYCNAYGCFPRTDLNDNSWSDSDPQQTGVPFTLDGGAGVTVSLAMTHANGNQYVAGGTYTLQPNVGTYNPPPECYYYSYSVSCNTTLESWNSHYGSGSGFGVSGPP